VFAAFSVVRSPPLEKQPEKEREVMPSIRESNLPGVGRKFQIEATSGDKLTIVIHDDGRRELYHFARENPDRVASVVTLHDSEARQVAGIIGGLTYVPKALATAEIVLDDLVLEWYTIPAKAYGVGKTIRDLMVRTETGASIVSIIEENRAKLINPEADTRLNAGATLIVAGDRKSINALKHLLAQGRGG
jgi:TrkA domain protein